MVTTAASEIPHVVLRMMRERETVYAGVLKKAIVSARRKFGHPDPAYSDEDLLQVIRGICAVMQETIEGLGTAIRLMYLESSAEGLMRAGVVPFPYQIHVVAACEVGVVADMVPLLAEADRQPAVDWLTTFFADYLTDLTVVTIRFSPRTALPEQI